MRCPYCGTNNEADALFCGACGKQLTNAQGSRTQNRSESRVHPKKRSAKVSTIIVLLILLVVLTVSVIGWIVLQIWQGTMDATQVVKTGYLGEYTDMTVEEMLDYVCAYNGIPHTGGNWSSKKNADGKTIVQAEYADVDGGNSLIIQFEMLNKECFKVVSVAEPEDTDEDYPTDILGGKEEYRKFLLNYQYICAYVEKDSINDPDSWEFGNLSEKLKEACADSVGYGASKSYRGDREKICQLEGKQLSHRSVINQLSEFNVPVQSFLLKPEEAYAPDPTVPIAATPVVTTPPPTVPKPNASNSTNSASQKPSETPQQEQSSAQLPQTSSGKKTGYVRLGVGELVIRSEPGVGYSEVGRLREGTRVDILETTWDGDYTWGRIERGWVCMDYIEAGDPPASSSQSVSMQVRVKWDAGELNVRGGPGTSYSQVGRLKAGDIVTISAIETVGGTDWGYISAQGWINMDYVDTDITEIPAQSGGSKFLGNWGDKKGQRCFLSISLGISDTYIIYLHWSSGAAYNTEWSAIGWYDDTNDCIRYDSCESWNTISDGNGNFTEEVRYTDGEGKFYFGGDGLYWQENKENMESRCCFEKLS